MSLRKTAGRLVARAGGRLARAGEVLADEGLRGLGRRAVGRASEPDPPAAPPDPPLPSPPTIPIDAEHYAEAMRLGPGEFDRQSILGPEKYAQLIAAFAEVAGERAAAIGHPGLGRYTWYHTVDLGEGLSTPGMFDLRGILDRYAFPDDMSGLRALDVGTATGFFAFEFERRGADVIATDIDSILDWDMPAGEDREITVREMMDQFGVETVQEVTRHLLTGPFDFCHRMRGSKVRKAASTIYGLTLEKLGGEPFDWVLVGDLLEHTFSPLGALSAVAPLCRGTLVLSSLYPVAIEDQPVMFYAGGPARRADNRTWWYPSLRCLKDMLTRLGFTRIEVVGSVEGHLTLDIHTGLFRRVFLHATK